jgi:hypothetical protein
MLGMKLGRAGLEYYCRHIKEAIIICQLSSAKVSENQGIGGTK